MIGSHRYSTTQHTGAAQTAPERNDMKYELLIIWTTGETNTYKCDTKEKAEEAEGNMRMAFGNQIAWSCIREER